MGDSLLIGPSTQMHVRVADQTTPLVIYRTGGGLGVKTLGGTGGAVPLDVDQSIVMDNRRLQLARG